MEKKVKKFAYDIVYCFSNYIIAHIPLWFVRKILYMALGMKIGKKSRINMCVTIFSPWKIRIGDSTIVNEYSLLDGRGGLTIGNNCSISCRSAIYTASHDISSNVFEGYKKEVIIEDGVWICFNAVVLPGVLIRENCVIAANSVLNRDTDRGYVYGSGVAKRINKRDVESINMEIISYFR